VRRRRVLYDEESQRGSMSPTLTQNTPGPPSRKRLADQRKQRQLPPASSQTQSVTSGDAVDLDDVDQLDIGELFKSATEGRLTDRLQSWWEQRDLRALKSDLDDEFRSLYALYADRAEAESDFYDDVYDVADRWADEADRLRTLAEDEGGGKEETSMVRSVLAELAAEAADGVADEVDKQTADTIETIHAHARAGDEAMAWYLVYLNRHAFFAGREPRYRRHAERIERMAQEMREAGR
jgi:hypothetical protein